MHALELKRQKFPLKKKDLQNTHVHYRWNGMAGCLPKHLVSGYDLTPKMYKYLLMFGTNSDSAKRCPRVPPFRPFDCQNRVTIE